MADAASSPSPFERIEEYKAVLDDTAQAANRRRTDNTLFVGLNTLFLTGLGLVASPQAGSWGAVLTLTIVTLIALPVNVFWRTSLTYWMKSLSVREEYIRSIEQEFRTRSSLSAGELPIGLYLYLRSKQVGRLNALRLERRLALFFLLIYPLATLLVAVLTWTLRTPLLPPFR